MKVWRFVSLCFVVLYSLLHIVISVEIEATKEWQLLGENDTIAAGMHVRMDLTTGEKWVKLPDEDETNEQQLAILPNGDIENEGSDAPDPELDFDMMHRTLSKLPEEDQKEMGLPTLPSGTVKLLKSQERKLFEEQMTKIWNQRQEELKKWQEEYLADLPKLIKDRIKSLQEYIQDPYTHLSELSIEPQESNIHSIRNINDVLIDLEYQLSDVDMARDFHTLGGWPILASFLDPTIHEVNGTLSDELKEKREVLITNAAWALGTAVSNIGEFTPFATEPVPLGDTRTTVIDLLSYHLQESDWSTIVLQQKLQKIIYGLSSMLRGNRMAQIHWSAIGGPAVAEQCLEKWHGVEALQKLSKKLIALAGDIVQDVILHQSSSQDSDMSIIQSLSTDRWCTTVVDSIQNDFLAETALHTVKSLSAHCKSSWDKAALRESLDALERKWKHEDADEDVHHDRIKLLKSVRILTQT